MRRVAHPIALAIASLLTAAAPALGDGAPPAAEGRVVAVTAYPAPTAAAPAPAAAAAATHAAAPVARAASTSGVTIRDFSFGPAAVTIHAGDTISWTNDGPTDHTATGGSFDTGTLRKGQSGSHSFTQAGTFAYHCSLHPFMKGTITVLASTAGASAPAAAAPAAPTAPTAPAAPATPAAPAQPTGPQLPNTGIDALPLGALGLLLLALGLLLRARTSPRHPDSPS